MAVDTAAKRYSIIAFGETPLAILPIPDAAVSAADRAHRLALYSGIALGAPVQNAVILNDVTVTGRQAARGVTGQQGAHALTGRQPASTVTGRV